MKTTFKLQIQIAFLVMLQVAFMIYCINVLPINVIYIIFAFFVLNLFIMIWIFVVMKVFRPKKIFHSDQDTFQNMIEFGEFSMLQYDENYNIIQTTGLLHQNHELLLSKKIAYIDERLNDFVLQNQGKMEVHIENSNYEVTKLKNENVLIFKNMDEIAQLRTFKKDNAVVIGLFQIDNYNETISYSEEREISEIIATLRKTINDWAFKNQILIRRLRDDRYFLVTRFQTLTIIKETVEAFLKEFKQKSEELEISVTASIVFAYGSEESHILDAKANELLELAQARGGDQMVVQKLNEKIEYYGGNTESFVVKSKTSTRIIADAIIDLMHDSKKIFVFGHQTMDFDSMGSCIAISKLGECLNKEVFIVSESGGIEAKLSNFMREYAHELNHHQFISDTQAVLLYEKGDLVILVDHHNPKHSAAQELVNVAQKTVVIDHHRRGIEFVKNPILTHLETGASSVCEMMVDLFQACPYRIEFSKTEAMILYTGIVVDTNQFVARTSAKTFEACAFLKQFGIDVALVREILSETIDDFKVKSKILECAYQLNHMMIAALDQPIFVTRTTLSQISDQLVAIQDIDAAFTIGYVSENKVAVSARSNKNVNVQVIMEKMQGGGHFNAAAVQIEGKTVSEVEQELKAILEERD